MEGDQIGIITIAQDAGSALDTYIYLLDSSGAILAENDDIVMYELRDSSLSYRLPHTGTYYIKVRAWNHPSAGGDDHAYTLHLAKDSSSPTAEITSPLDGARLPEGISTISVNASDEGSGISHVDFFWHSGDWEYGNWDYLGTDWDNSDGWAFDFDTSSLPDQAGIAFFARVHDWAGNTRGAGVWDLYLGNLSRKIYFPIIISNP